MRRMDAASLPWVEQAAGLPIAFAQVREDPLLDQWVVDRIEPPVRVAMIASGGCTAAFLAACPAVGRLHLVDPNLAQLALTRLKLRLLQTADCAERCALLGHQAMPVDLRQGSLMEHLSALGLDAGALGPMPFVATAGPDHAGRYECATIGKAVVERGWVHAERLVHYKLHAEIDERHAEEFFAVIEPNWDEPRRRYYIEQGLELGAYIFDRLYRDLYEMASKTGR